MLQHSLCKDASTHSTYKGAKPLVRAPSSTHLEEAATVHAPAGLHGDALAPVEDEALVALAALEALAGAAAAGGEAGARLVTSAGAELVVAVGRAGERWRVEKQKEKLPNLPFLACFLPLPPQKHPNVLQDLLVPKRGLRAGCFSLAKASPRFHARCFPSADFSK